MRRLALALALVVLAGSGCGGDQDTASTTATAPPASAVGPGLTVAEAIESDLEGPLLVRGALVELDGTLRLCDALAESYPPQCGGASLVVDGYDIAAADGMQQASGVRWAEGAKLLGEVDDGVLRVSPTATG
ncbi:MAG TPA: hypothetical protein VK874_08630 [Gaiellaceae bacterium]|nr:hypothetical protein [Gaiellaceae bacterium]